MNRDPLRLRRAARSARRPSRRVGSLAVEQFESRLLLSGDVLTWHNDNGRTGQYLTETTLNLSNVNSGTFGKLFTDPVDGQVYAQPLYKAAVPIVGKGVHNVVFVATENDSLYAFDADNGGAPLWQVSFVNPAAGITVPTQADLPGSTIQPTIGTTSTPVIDATSNTIYVVANIKVTANGTSTFQHVLHAVDITTGQDRASTVILPTRPGTNAGSVKGQITYQAQYSNQRPALLLSNGVIYIASASYGDSGPYNGWVIGYEARTLALANAWIVAPDFGQGGIWMSGAGPAADAQGNIYVSTGNGPFTANLPGRRDYGQAYVKLSPTGGDLHVVDYFAPYNANALNNVDGDIGSSGVLLLPDIVDPATGLTHREVFGGAKQGTLYLMNQNNLGGFNSTPGATSNPNIVQEIPYTLLFSTPAYYNNQVYVSSPSRPLAAFGVKPDGTLTPNPVSLTTNNIGSFGISPSISANGSSDGIVWANSGGVLYAYDASDLSKTLYASNQAGSRDFLGNYVKFSVVTVANGKVYVGTQNGLVAFGLLSAPTTPPVGVSAVASSSTTADLTWTNPSLKAATEQFRVFASTNGGATYTPIGTTAPGALSFAAKGLTPSTSYLFRVTTFNGAGDSPPSNTAAVKTPPAAGEVNYNGGFAAATGLNLVGTAAISGSGLQLTNGGTNQTAAAYASAPVPVSSFVTRFDFQIANPRGEGFTFILQGNGPTSLGGGGSGLGSRTLTKSVAVKFDLANNGGEGTNTTGLFLRGATPTVGGVAPATGSLNLTDGAINLFSGNPMTAVITYDGAILQVTITDPKTGATASQSYAVDIASVVGGTTAYVGFTAATAGSSATQTILNWSYTPGAQGPPVGPTGLTATRPVPTEIDLSWTNHSGSATAILVEQSTDGVLFTQVASLAGNATSVALPGLGATVAYTFRIRAANAAGQSPYSNNVTNPPVTQPQTPTEGAASQVTATTLTLTWRDNADNENSYQILRKAGSGLYSLIATLPANTTTYADSGLSPNTTYSYHILAVNAAGNADFTGVLVTTPPPGVPQSPEGVRAQAVSSTRIDLSWINTATPAYAVTAVHVLQSADGEDFTQIASLDPAATTYSVTGLAPSTTYYFRVLFANIIGESEESFDPSATTPASDVPSAPTGLSATAASPSQVNLTWTNTSVAANAVLVEQSSDGVNFTQVAHLAANATTYEATGLLPSITYLFRVRASGISGNSAYSNTASATTPSGLPLAPTGLSATAASATQINLSWTNAATNATTVLVERSTDGVTFNQVANLASNATSYSATGLSPSTAYTFRVRATNAAGTSPYSSTATATTQATSPGGVIDYSGGFAGASGLALTGKAALSGPRLRLTDGGLSQYAGAFAAAPVNVTKFSTQFSFQLTNAQADGFTFAIAGKGPAGNIGAGGAGLGTWRLAKSVAVKFDLYNNAGEGFNSTGLFLNGAYPTTGGVTPSSGAVDLTGTGVNLRSGNVMSASLAYDGTTLRVTITDTRTGTSATQAYAVDIASIVGGPTAYVGFTAGTGGLSAVQDILSWTYSADNQTAPSAPTGLSATAASPSQVNLTWTNTSVAANAVLVEQSSDGVNFTQVAHLAANATTYEATGLLPSITYLFRVRASGISGNSAYSNTASATTPSGLPLAPTGLSATAASATQINLSWTNAATNATTVLVERSTDGVTFNQVANLASNATSYSATGLSPSTAYTFRVRATNAAGTSPYSSTATATTQATSPGGVIDYSGGFAGASGLALTGKAALSGPRLRLTDGGLSQYAGAFAAAPVNVTKFSTQFSFQLTNAQADGFTFAIAGKGPAGNIGAGGAGLGTWRLAKSVAVKFDLYNNAGEGFNSTGLFLNGAYPTTGGVTPSSGAVDLTGTGVNLRSGNVMSASLAYDGTTLRVTITDTRTGTSATQAYAVDIASIVGGPTAYVGFTAGTGGLSAVQDILSWNFR